MKRIMLAALVALAPMSALGATWSDVSLIDHNCLAKYGSTPDVHTTACLLRCAGSGYGILDHGAWIPLDPAGNEKAVAALKATHRKDHIRVNVTGDRKGDVLHVSSLEIVR